MCSKEQAEYLFHNPNKLKHLRRGNTRLFDEIVQRTDFLPKESKTKPRLWHIINDVNEIITCKMCDNPVRWDDTAKSEDQGYRTYCSHKCQHSDPEMRSRKTETEIERYGVGRESIVERIKKTNRQKYGADFFIQTEEGKSKRDDTCLDIYGVPNPAQSEKVKEKKRETNLKRFGKEHAAQSEECKKKSIKTMIGQYGSVESRYESSTKKMLDTMNRKYGANSFSQKHVSPETLAKLNDKSWLEEQNQNGKTLTQIAEDLGVVQATVARYFHGHGIPLIRFPSSIYENEIADFLSDNRIEFVQSERSLISPQELDIYIPSHDLAIELDGIYWHSELQGRNRNYHLEKTKKCNRQGIHLVHIFENEWILKRDIVESRLLSLMGKNARIFARKCEVAEIRSDEARNFFNETHIQGYAKSKTNLALTYHDKIVAVMSFGKSRFDGKTEYELIRYSTQLHTNIVGGASRLFKHFLNNFNPESIVSYSDRRWNTGNLYRQLGFEFVRNSTPNYFYFLPQDITRLYSRINFQKHKLVDVLERFDPDLTEWENMSNNGYDRIWDCGNSVWRWSDTIVPGIQT